MDKIQLRDFLRYRFLSSVKASPDGGRAAFVVTVCDEERNTYRHDIWLYENGACRPVTTDGRCDAFLWEDDGHLLLPCPAKGATPWKRLDLADGTLCDAFTLPFFVKSMQRLDASRWFFTARDKRPPEEGCAAVEGLPIRFNGLGYTSPAINSLYLFDTSSGALKKLSPEGFLVTHTAVYRGGILYSGARKERLGAKFDDVRLYDPCSDTDRAVYEKKDLCVLDLREIDGQAIVVVRERIRHSFDQNPTFCRLDMETGTYIPLAAPDFNPENSVLSDCTWGMFSAFGSDGKYLYCLAARGCDVHLLRMDVNGRIEPVCTKPGAICSFDVTADGQVYAAAQYDGTLNELYRLGAAPEKLSDFNGPVLAGKSVSQPRPITVPYQDWMIDGWVLPPADYDPGRQYPAVLEIHGGPKNIYSTVFFHEMQVLAAEGYFVLFCNPVGSDGKGTGFFEAIRARYGTVDYESLMAFTDAALEAYPQIDRSRVAVTGGSYGGFMTNWIIGHTGRFACAVSQRSISNMLSFWGTADVGYNSVPDKNGGDIYTAPELLWEQSPLKYARNVTTPTLFLHSDEDYRCPLEQGVQMYTAVSLTGTDTRLVVFKGENHSLSRTGKPRSRIRRLEEQLNWIKKYTAKD
ncbi:MAG: alpha/beta hydrolase family protein [Oscillospiraceae bacterium]